MTREEIELTIDYLKNIQNEYTIVGENDGYPYPLPEWYALDNAIEALEQEPKTEWNNHQIACMLADLFGDACACNYNGIDEWLGELCDFKDTCCPNPVGVACWEQFLKYSQSRYTECGYEARDKNALQEPKKGHWIRGEERHFLDTRTNLNVEMKEATGKGYHIYINAQCSKCQMITIHDDSILYQYCPHCGAKMQSESEVEE